MRPFRLTRLATFHCSTIACVLLLLFAAAIPSHAQTFATIHSFDNTDGSLPGVLLQATDGKLYATADEGGSDDMGTIFKITTTGTLTTLLSLDGTDGSYPYGTPMVQAPNGDFYGTMQAGGANEVACSGGCGTFFRLTSGGTLATLYSFCSQTNCTDGSTPLTTLIQAANGDFYGTTSGGGANCVVDGGCGTVFKITPSGTLTTLYSFCSQTNCTDGAYPFYGMIQATNGDFYGTTIEGGANGDGTVFKITPAGTFTTLYSFCAQSGCTDGNSPKQLMQASNGDIYGATHFGGTSASCTNGCGTLFKMTLSGALTTFYDFDGTDGSNPGGPIQATDGNFYGLTHDGGNEEGTIYKITPGGTLTTLYNFCAQTNCTDGSTPAGLMQDTNGKFYGSTLYGGTSTACTGGCGTIYSFSVGLKPFVETQTTSGAVGAAVKILGSNLTGATSVTFNGTSAVFTVASSSLITTTVPAGATTGKVQVTTPSGTLTSNVTFRVTP